MHVVPTMHVLYTDSASNRACAEKLVSMEHNYAVCTRTHGSSLCTSVRLSVPSAFHLRVRCGAAPAPSRPAYVSSLLSEGRPSNQAEVERVCTRCPFVRHLEGHLPETADVAARIEGGRRGRSVHAASYRSVGQRRPLTGRHGRRATRFGTSSVSPSSTDARSQTDSALAAAGLTDELTVNTRSLRATRIRVVVGRRHADDNDLTTSLSARKTRTL